MKIGFTKMQGCGNDYVYIDCIGNDPEVCDRSDLARKISDRHFGVGSDGLIFIRLSPSAGFEMEMYNADGSRSEMCGNGIRCVARYVYDHQYTNSNSFDIESMGKVKHINISKSEDGQYEIRVDMGEPILEPTQIPVSSRKQEMIAEGIEVGGRSYKITCVSMGNPHAVVFSGLKGSESFDLTDLDIMKIGPAFEHHPLFPARVNTEFVQVIDRKHMKMRVWERGAGETLACGTGCCAACVAGVLNGLTDNEVSIDVPGGTLKILWDENDGHVYMTGPAETVFTGTYDYLQEGE